MLQLLRLDPADDGGRLRAVERGGRWRGVGSQSLVLLALQSDAAAAALEFHSLRGDVYYVSPNGAKNEISLGASVKMKTS